MTSATAAIPLLAPKKVPMLSCGFMMEAHGGPQVLTTSLQHPSSPPISPDSTEAFRSLKDRQTAWKRHGLYGGIHISPPSDDIHGHGPIIRASTPELLNVPGSLSRPSTSSGVDDSPRRGRSTPDFDAQSETSNARSSILYWRSEEFELLIEELPDDDPRFLTHSGLLRPDRISEAGSERAVSPPYKAQDDMIKRIEELHCDELEEDVKNEAVRKWRRRRNRWSTRSKRTWSQSYGSDIDIDDTSSLGFDDIGPSMQHPAKRRKSELQQRASLIFDDPPLEHMTEVDEPDEEAVWIDPPPPFAEVDWSDLGLRSLPFCILLESESEYTSSEDEEDD